MAAPTLERQSCLRSFLYSLRWSSEAFLLGQLGWFKADGQGARGTGPRRKYDQRGLDETQAADEVDAVLGPERIAPSRDAGNAESGFAEDRVIHGDDDGHRIGSQKLQRPVDDDIKQTARVPGTAGKETVIGGPIQKLPAGSANGRRG